jgi:hypothetical protein
MEWQDYVLLRDLNLSTKGELAVVLNRNGAANLTVCPRCRVDDFVHVEGCQLAFIGATRPHR